MIQTQNNTVTYVVEGNEYIFPYKFFSKEDLNVFLDSTALVRDVDWTIEQKEDYSDGAKIFLKDTANTRNASGKKLTVLRAVPYTQAVSLPTYGKLDSKVLEEALDRLTMIAQQLFEKSDRSIVLPPGSNSADLDKLLVTISQVKLQAESALKSAAEANGAAEEAAELLRQAEEIQRTVAEALKKSAGIPIGSVYSSPGTVPPEGAYLLNGQTIPNCAESYKRFWAWLHIAGVRIIDNDTFETEIAKYGVCNGFVIDSAQGNVRLPKWHYQSPLGETLPVRGNGVTLGLTDGSTNLGVFEKNNDGVNGSEAIFGTSIGSSGDGSTVSSTKSLGITTDPDKSGIVAENNAPADHFVLCIQVYNAATDLSEQESAQLASIMQTKAQTDLGNVTANVDFVTETWRDGAGGWYRKYRSGWIEQGGFVTGKSSATVNLWQEMADSEYSLIISYTLSGTSTDTGGAETTPLASNRTPTTFRVSLSTTTTTHLWEVKGCGATE